MICELPRRRARRRRRHRAAAGEGPRGARGAAAVSRSFAAAAERHGKLFAVNDRADIARAVGAPILHLGQDDLPVPIARDIVGDEPIIGRSTHSPEQSDAALAEAGVDYVCCRPDLGHADQAGAAGRRARR